MKRNSSDDKRKGFRVFQRYRWVFRSGLVRNNLCESEFSASFEKNRDDDEEGNS